MPHSHSSDDPPSDPISAETPSTKPAEDLGSEPTTPSHPNPSAENVSNESDPQGRMADSGETPRLPRRRRRRRRPPRTADPAEATAAPQDPAEQSAIAGNASLSGDLPATPPPEGQPRRRRRRLAGPPDTGSAEVAAVGAQLRAAPIFAECRPGGDGEPRRAGRTNSHAGDAAPGLHTQRKRAQPRLTFSSVRRPSGETPRPAFGAIQAAEPVGAQPPVSENGRRRGPAGHRGSSDRPAPQGRTRSQSTAGKRPRPEQETRAAALRSRIGGRSRL
jgi:hypothetical protein